MKKQIKFYTSIFLCLYGYSLSAQNIPSIGRTSLLEIANWNIAWFGKTTAGYGPSDDTLQQARILQIIQKADIDVWAFTEVADSNAFNKMMQQLPTYQAVIANYHPEQKTACIFKSEHFTLLYSKLLGKTEKDSFSTGRYPLEIALIPKQNTSIDTLFLIVIHLKANIGNDSNKMLAYNSRKRSAEWIEWKTKTTYSNRFCIVLGDWNDDIDRSIFNQLPSPFVNLENTFFFNSRVLSDTKKGTTTSYPDAVDHQLISPLLQSKYIPDSTFVWRLDQYIDKYGSTCSDHYPVYSFFNMYSNLINENLKKPVLIYYANRQEIGFRDFSGIFQLQIYNLSGQTLIKESFNSENTISTSVLRPGMYLILLENGIYNYHYLLRIMPS